LKHKTATKWKWFPIALYQFETNYIYQVKNRHRYGLGVGAYPIDEDGYLLRFTTGWFCENQLYNFNKFVNSDIENPKTKGVLELDFWYFQSFKQRLFSFHLTKV